MSKGIGGDFSEAISRIFREATGSSQTLGAPEVLVSWGTQEKRLEVIVAWDVLLVLPVAWGAEAQGLSDNPETLRSEEHTSELQSLV